MIANFHSLLNRPWYIEQNYAQAHMPLLFNILSGKQAITSPTKETVICNRHSNANNNSNTNTNKGLVAVIDLKDPIYKYDQECGPRGTQTRIAILESLKNDDSIVGIVFDVDSGGGQVSGTPEFYDYIKSYPKPTVTYTAGYMCSAAYYIGSAADHLIANPRAEAIGSIGAYIQFLDLTGYYEKEGAKLHTIYASKSSEKNKAYRDALEGNYDTMVKEELDPIVEDFITDIKGAMANVDPKVFKGATYNGKTALKLNLVNELGSLQDAINKVYELSDSQKKTTNNLDTMNTTERTNVQSVLGLDAPLAATENGSYLNDEQLDAMESHLADSAIALATAESATQTAQDALTQEQQTVTDLGTSLNALAVSAGIEAQATTAETITALENRIAELSKTPGDVHTTVVKTKTQNEAIPEYVDLDCSIYTAHKN